MKKAISFLLLFFALCSCKESNKDRITRLIKEWEGKEILFPAKMVFTKYGIDTLDYQTPNADWKIISYIDSVGCTSCKLQFQRWKKLMNEMDSISGVAIPFLFAFHPKGERGRSELRYLMKRDNFDYPVWVDEEDEFNRMNKFPAESMLQAFLVDSDNKIVAMGSPFQNPRVRELYLQIIGGSMERPDTSTHTTEVTIEQTVADLGEFDWAIPQEVIFTLKNNGSNRLVVNDVVASCGCMSVDYPKHPVDPGKNISIKLTYTAEEPGRINKTLMLYANIKSPVQLEIRGKAQ